MSGSFGKILKVTVFGESHSEAIGCVIDGLPAGIKLPLDFIEAFMKRRNPGDKNYSTKRCEGDIPEIISGAVDFVTTGAPLCAVIKNHDARHGDYEKIRDIPRPMHGDFPAGVKFHGFNDIRGGGQFSGRLTAPICFGGAIALKLLEAKGIFIGSHIARLGGISDSPYDPVNVSCEDFKKTLENSLPVISKETERAMLLKLAEAEKNGDSLGGVIECAAIGLPVGLGEPNFESLESRLSANIFSIPAVKAVEFGEGIAAADLKGSEYNDSFTILDGKVSTVTNRHGGILGGMATGMPLIFRCYFKPTPSISIKQQSVNLKSGEITDLIIEGRHDTAILMRAAPVVEAVCALTLADLLLEGECRNTWSLTK